MVSWTGLDDGDSSGEPGWIRTIDPYIKSVLLYQLSYEPLAFTDENFEGIVCTKTPTPRQCESALSQCLGSK